jgi:two-component system, cell cycle sensor histidine kinase and response regulator CckA
MYEALDIISFCARIILLLISVPFAYYSILKAKIMTDSKGRQILAFSSIFAVIASILNIVSSILSRNITLEATCFILWSITTFTFIYGGLIVAKGIKSVYKGSIFKMSCNHPIMVKDTIGSMIMIFFGIPMYLLHLLTFANNMWIDFINTVLWISAIAFLALATRGHYLSIANPKIFHEKEFMIPDNLLAVRAYGILLNRFLSAINFPIMGLIRREIAKFLEHNPILFDNCAIKQDGTIDFQPALKNANRININNRTQDICIIFSAFGSKLLDLFGDITSRKHAETTLAESYEYIKESYETSSVVFDILRSLPEGVLEEEKIILLPRSELETRVRERTKELEESKKYINDIIDSMIDMLIVVDPDCKIRNINKAVEKTLNYSADELIGKSVNDIIPKEGEVNFLDNCDLPKNAEKDFVSKTGENITVLFSSSVLHDDEDKIQGIVCLAHDITERKTIENALKESEEEYRLVVDNANEAIAVSQDGFLKFVNPKTIEISGYSESELLSRSFAEFIHPDDRDFVLERHWKRLMGEEGPNSYIFRIINSCGDIRWIEINTISIVWEGKPATLDFMDDITEKRRMQEDLFRVQKLESIGILAGGIAHDFNNILTGIMGNVSLSKRIISQDSRAFDRLVEAERACLQAKKLTQQLLTFAKGGAPILKPTPIKELLEESVGFALRGSRVRPEFSIADDLWSAEADAGQMGQVISNLIINADQAMPNGGVIKIHASNEFLNERNPYMLKSRNYVKITVEDQGTGISEENLKRIFDPYFTTKQTGSGLGLTIVYSIIKKHNGYIKVESKSNAGTTFYIYLPATSETIGSKKDEIEEKLILGKGRILVMDDEKTIRELATEILGNIGYEVEVAADGSEAVEIYKNAKKEENPFDAVIMDLTIPGGMGGTEAIKEMQEFDPNVRAIVSSGYSDDPVMSDFRNHGFKDVIAKPYRISELSEVVHRIINTEN